MENIFQLKNELLRFTAFNPDDAEIIASLLHSSDETRLPQLIAKS